MGCFYPFDLYDSFITLEKPDLIQWNIVLPFIIRKAITVIGIQMCFKHPFQDLLQFFFRHRLIYKCIWLHFNHFLAVLVMTGYKNQNYPAVSFPKDTRGFNSADTKHFHI